MRDFKRITLFCGHYGSGKTNIAVNVALNLKKVYDKVAVADLDKYRAKFLANILKTRRIK